MRARPVCKVCGRNKVATKGWRLLTTGERVRKYKSICNACYSRKRKGLTGPASKRALNPVSKDPSKYARYKGDRCECCGFVAVHPCQLDVDHLDGNGANHDPSNLQTLCANCHRLKTQLAGDHLSPRLPTGAPHQTHLDALWREHDPTLS